MIKTVLITLSAMGLLLLGMALARPREAQVSPSERQRQEAALQETPAPSPAAEQEPEPTIAPEPGNGLASISGSLVYPGSHIPASLGVCAVNTETGSRHCSTQLSDPSFIYGKGYEIQAPPGTYRLTTTGTTHDAPYTSYMPQVRSADSWPEYPPCSEVEVLPITVASGETVTGITMADWWLASCQP